jgi:membrane protease YdiL (CAAX protease family)
MNPSPETPPSPIQTVKRPSAPGQEYAATFVTGALVFAFLWFYQYHWSSRSYEEYIAVTIGALLFVPLLSLLLGMRSSPETFGMTAGDSKRGWRYALGMLIVMIPFLWLSANSSGAMSYYPFFRRFPAAYPYSWKYLLYFEALYGMYLFAWEWFFRGFLLFGLARGMGTWSLFAQAIPFGLLHYGKPTPEFIGSFVAGLVLGFVALRTGSFLAGFLTHWTITVLYDLMVLLALANHGIRLF